MSAVAWMVGNDVCKTFHQAKLQSDFHGHPVVPLYTYKDLADEEIVFVWNSFERTDNIPFIEFARAILRKAQEK